MKLILTIFIAQVLSLSVCGQMETAVEKKKSYSVSKPFEKETK